MIVRGKILTSRFPEEFPNISKDFVNYFIETYENEEKWTQAGYNTKISK